MSSLLLLFPTVGHCQGTSVEDHTRVASKCAVPASWAHWWHLPGRPWKMNRTGERPWVSQKDFGRSVLLGVWNVPFPLREGDRCVPVQIGHWKWVVVSVNCQCTKAHDWHWGKGWGRGGKAFWNLCEEYKGRGSACANCRGNLLHIYMHILYRIKTLQYSCGWVCPYVKITQGCFGLCFHTTHWPPLVLLCKPSWISLKAAAQTDDNADLSVELLWEGKAWYFYGMFSWNGLLEQKRYLYRIVWEICF